MIFVLIFLLCLLKSTSYAGLEQHNAKLSQKSEDSSILQRLTLTFYKASYFILITAILCCALYHFAKTKLAPRNECESWGSEKAENIKTLTVTEASLTGCVGVLNDADVDEKSNILSESDNELRQRLKRTQDEIEILRKQLSHSMDRKTELESTLALIDKEKISAEMQLELDRVQGLVELEKMKKDSLALKRDVQRLLEEKELAEKEAERLDRDAKISVSAITDAEFLEERLDTAKREANVLKKHYGILTVEKKKASAVLNEPSGVSMEDLEYQQPWSLLDVAQEFMISD